MQYLFLFKLSLLLFFSLNKSEWNYELEFISESNKSSYIIKVFSYSKKPELDIEKAKKNAIHGVIFQGVGNHPPLNQDLLNESKHVSYFNSFFGKNKLYQKYVDTIVRGTPIIEDISKVKRGYKISTILIVDHLQLRKDLEKDGTIKKLTTRSIVIATGARPFVPPLPGIEETGYVTSDTLWNEFAKLDEAPKKLVVLGGGPIGSELAQSFARLGSSVTQIEMAERIMIKEDLEVSEFATESLKESGVNILTSHQALRCETKDGKKFIIVKHNDEEIAIEYDQLLCAVGRSARLTGYGLEELGIETNRTILTNEYLETIYPNIFAAGDIVGPYQFTHVAAHQGWYAAVNGLFGNLKKFKVDYRVIPWTTFIDPEVARVGINEDEAKQKGIDYEITRFDFEELDRAITDSATKGFIKVITPKGKDKILGVTIVSEHAGDLIAEFVLAMKHGLGLNKILGTIHSYPTWAEGNKYAAGEWKRNHAPETVLSWLEKYHAWRRG